MYAFFADAHLRDKKKVVVLDDGGGLRMAPGGRDQDVISQKEPRMELKY